MAGASSRPVLYFALSKYERSSQYFEVMLDPPMNLEFSWKGPMPPEGGFDIMESQNNNKIKSGVL